MGSPHSLLKFPSVLCTLYLSNALAVAAGGYTLGLTPQEIRAGIEGLPSMPGRGNIIETERLIILADWQISGSFYKFFIRLKPDTLGGGTDVFGAFCQRSGEGADPAYQVGGRITDCRSNQIIYEKTLPDDVAEPLYSSVVRPIPLKRRSRE